MKWIPRIGLVVCMLMAAGAMSADTQSATAWEEAKTRAVAYVDSGECDRAWDVLWPWAKSGQGEARAILAGGIFAAGLIPPGGTADTATRIRDMLTFAVHGLAGPGGGTREIVDGLLQSELVTAMGARELRRCLASDKAAAACVDVAVESGFVPEFADFAQDIDLAAAARPRDARCLPHHQGALPARPE